MNLSQQKRVKEVKEPSERRKGQYRVIYDLFWSGNPRIYIKTIASKLHVDPRTAGRIVREAINLGYVTRPQIRRRSHANMKEYVCFVNCEDPLELYLQYGKDNNVSYHAVMNGFSNFWAISKERIDIEGDVLIEGYRSDFHAAFAPNRSWKKAIQIMQEKVRTFDPKDYEPKGIIKNHWDEAIPWDVEDENLFREFKYDLRKPFTKIMKKYLISTTKIYQWLDRLTETCTVFTRYFPDGFRKMDSSPEDLTTP